MKSNDWFFDIFTAKPPNFSGHPDEWTEKEWKRHNDVKRLGVFGYFTNQYVNSAIIGVILTTISYLVGFLAGWIESVNYLEVFAVFTSYMSTWLCVVEKRFNYVAGAISSFAYAILFVQSDLVASAILNFYLAPALVYGWFRWGKDAVTRPVQHVQVRMLPVYLLVTGLGYLGALGVAKLAGGTLALTDSLILVGTILAQFLLDNKKIETWGVWAVVNIFAIYTYFSADLQLVGSQYIFFLINTVIGYIIWNRSKNDKV